MKHFRVFTRRNHIRNQRPAEPQAVSVTLYVAVIRLLLVVFLNRKASDIVCAVQLLVCT